MGEGDKGLTASALEGASPALRAQGIEDMKHVPWKSAHDGHDPDDHRVVTVETLAMVMCSGCSDGEIRWRNPECHSEWLHAGDSVAYGEADECEAAPVLNAAVDAGIPIYTGAELEFDEDGYLNQPPGSRASEGPDRPEAVNLIKDIPNG